MVTAGATTTAATVTVAPDTVAASLGTAGRYPGGCAIFRTVTGTTVIGPGTVVMRSACGTVGSWPACHSRLHC